MRIIDWSSDVCSSDLAALIAKEMLGIVPAFALLADPIFHGDADIVEKDFIGITAAVDRFDRPHGDAGRFHIDEQEGDALLIVAAISSSLHRQHPPGRLRLLGPYPLVVLHIVFPIP